MPRDAESTPAAETIAPEIVQLLRCPRTGSPLRQIGDELVAAEDESIRYPIQHGVPRLLA